MRETEKERKDAASLGGKTSMTVACRMFGDRRNRFIRFGLYSCMRFFLAFFVLMTAQAMSLKDFNALPDREQSSYVATFIDKMTTDLRAKNPELAQNIRTWFARKRDDKPGSEGMERLFVELGALELQAKDGKADLSKIQLESVIVWVVKQKFPPPAR
jgi:hypothetical protein